MAEVDIRDLQLAEIKKLLDEPHEAGLNSKMIADDAYTLAAMYEVIYEWPRKAEQTKREQEERAPNDGRSSPGGTGGARGVW